MAGLDLEKSIIEVIGKDSKFIIMSEFFKTRSTRDIFCVVKDIKADVFYIFYDEDTTICHKMMGRSNEFSAFISLVYDIAFDISASKGWDKNMLTYDHIQAKDQGIDFIRYGRQMIDRIT